MAHRYTVLGAGRQGTSAAYDLAKNGDAERVLITDIQETSAKASAKRINDLLGSNRVVAKQLDVADRRSLLSIFTETEVVVSAVPFYRNLEIAKCALEAGTSMTDLGGHTDTVFQELEMDAAAKEKGITIVPDCGMVPGLGTSVCMYAMSLVEEPREVYLYDGGLPQDPQEPWKYILTFHFEGLVNEYYGTTEFLRDGKIVNVPCFEEYEFLEFPEPIGTLEAVTTAGGTSSAPRTFLGKLRAYENKTLRYPGHFAQWKAFRDAGFFETDSVQVKGESVRPRDVLAAVLDPKIRAKKASKMCASSAENVWERLKPWWIFLTITMRQQDSLQWSALPGGMRRLWRFSLLAARSGKAQCQWSLLHPANV